MFEDERQKGAQYLRAVRFLKDSGAYTTFEKEADRLKEEGHLDAKALLSRPGIQSDWDALALVRMIVWDQELNPYDHKSHTYHHEALRCHVLERADNGELALKIGLGLYNPEVDDISEQIRQHLYLSPDFYTKHYNSSRRWEVLTNGVIIPIMVYSLVQDAVQTITSTVGKRVVRGYYDYLAKH